MHTVPSATDVSLFREAPLVRRPSMNLIFRAKKRGGRLIPTWTVFDVRIYLKTSDVGTQGQNEGGCLVSGEVSVREGPFFFFFFFNPMFVDF